MTAAWLRLAPAPESRRPVVAFYDSVSAGCGAIEAVLGFGLEPAALEYLDRGALAAAAGFPGGIPHGAAFLVIADAEGTAPEAARQAGELAEALGAAALAVSDMEEARLMGELWRWREGVSFAVRAVRGGKIAEDVVVPVDRSPTSSKRPSRSPLAKGYRPRAGVTPATGTSTPTFSSTRPMRRS